jgi:hypothetical protein
MLAMLEKQDGPPAMVRGRIVTFKHYNHTWYFSLQPAFVTWDRPSNVTSWVRFERLRLVLANKVKVDQLRPEYPPRAPAIPPASPPPPSPPPSPPGPSAFDGVGDESDSDDRRAPPAVPSAAFAGVGDESDSDDRGAPPRATAAAQPLVGDEDASDAEDGGRPASAHAVGQKRPLEQTVGDDSDSDARPPTHAVEPFGDELPIDDDDDELGSDDDDGEEVEGMLDTSALNNPALPTLLALYTKPVHKKDAYKFDLHLGLLAEQSRIHMFREGKCELDFVDAQAFDAKMRRLGILR